MSIIELLSTMRRHGGEARTAGLPDSTILQFAASDPRLEEAVEAAHHVFLRLCED